MIDELRPLLERISIPSAAIRVDDDHPAAITGSFVGSHPYLPEGASWRQYHDLPMLFLIQINFAEVGPLPGFPTSGLLQWFIGANDHMLGFTTGASKGLEGFDVRRYPDTSAAPIEGPQAPTPWHRLRDEDNLLTPLSTSDARRLNFQVGRALPQLAEFTLDGDLEQLVMDLARLGGAPSDDPGVLAGNGWIDLLGRESPFRDDFVQGSSLGGSAYVTHEDPRGNSPNFPPIGDPAGQVLITLDQDIAPDWGVQGIAHLFGDPAAVARGDLSSVRYYWDCT